MLHPAGSFGLLLQPGVEGLARTTAACCCSLLRFVFMTGRHHGLLVSRVSFFTDTALTPLL